MNGRQGKYWHGGDWYMGSGRKAHSCIMTFPGGIEASPYQSLDSSIRGISMGLRGGEEFVIRISLKLIYICDKQD